MGRIYRGAPSVRERIYVETFIRAPLDRLWEMSQDPGAHPRWDLRFTAIVPTGTGSDGNTRFRYEFKLPFHTIRGTGISLGHRRRADGQATSVLKFSTTDPLSPIGSGAGYWRYVPCEGGVRFITGYDYEPGLGLVGRVLDRRVTRPALGWATAWSFDRLRLWAESDVDPATARTAWILDRTARAGGLAVAALLLRRSEAGPGHPTALPLLAVAAVTAVFTIPVHRTVPRARRCLRHAPDKHAGAAPSALATLPAPAQDGPGAAGKGTGS
ncbi:hypothetical protein GCM10010977_22120 [Citricoccus zhacaiensis]|uniref:SRPBCC family protein n=2 Tax=Citricoccus zhacaiensis TaxID=489142 RepID=A0ABQ2M480_9MICC|nr:hypothetical protein GCM10010977_22120 [Citricoccus zhacaiensis]